MTSTTVILDAHPLPDSWIPQVSGKGLGPGFSLSGPKGFQGTGGGAPGAVRFLTFHNSSCIPGVWRFVPFSCRFVSIFFSKPSQNTVFREKKPFDFRYFFLMLS